MSNKINIDGQQYDIESLPDDVKNTLSLIQMTQQRAEQARASLQIEEAAMQTLGQRLRQQIEVVDPVDVPMVSTGDPVAKE